MQLYSPGMTSECSRDNNRSLSRTDAGCDLDLGAPREEQRSLPKEGIGSSVETDILVSQWVDTRSAGCHEKSIWTSDRYLIGISLKATRVKLMRASRIVFDG